MAAKRGRPRKLQSVKELEGDDRPSRRRVEPTTVGLFPTRAPRQLTPAERKWWDRTVPELQYMGLARSADVALVLSYVEALALRDEALKEYKAHVRKNKSALAMGANGQLIQHPAIRMHRDYVKLADQLGIQLGLSPRGRTELATPDAPTGGSAGPLERLLS